MAEQDIPDYSHWLITATTIFLLWALLFAGVRTWAKLTRSLPWSFYDNTFTVAFVIAVAQCISVYVAISYGFGKAASTSEPKVVQWQKALFASQILYVLAVGISKCSTAFFLGNLTRNAKQKRPSMVVAGLSAIWTVASVFAIALRGDLQKPWSTIDGTETVFTRWLGIEASGLIIEIVLWVLSITLVWGLNMPVLKRLKVIGLFAVRLLVIGIVTGRLYFLAPANNHQTTRANVMAYIFTEAAMLYYLMSECMSCLKPFLQPFHSGYGLSENYALGAYSNPYRAPYAGISNISHSANEPEKDPRIAAKELPADEESQPASRRSSQRRRRRQELENRVIMRSEYSPFSSHTAHIEASNGKSHGVRRSDEDDLLNRQSAGIQQTTTISVANDRL